MNTLARRLLTASPLVLVAACSSAPPPQAAANGEPMIYVSSARSPSSIANCLEDRLPRVHESKAGSATELSIGSGSDASYFVTLTPSGNGSVIRVTHGASRSDDPPEPELRFDVARCTT
ncbi:sugar ABC transporter ATPase [Paraburkholderia dinghuensis]|uniref:Sugar ABC transporter ATPase n=1 Tax=Paraburkholderia dinghuensis TaxID=2305225 RepID=A0A3N6Q912_9BURK|nr:sugar ABC transporter ATPase [Paraburkholderia dinghuensis]RQH09046.1 sugar ABC transporter ATPase [Paraburkholderia dinghuensis]